MYRYSFLMSPLWTARADDLVTDSVDGSLIVYDTRTDQVHCLEGGARDVFRGATGQTLEAIAESTGIEAGRVADILMKLSELGLMDSTAPEPDRRRFLKLTAAGAAVGIWSLAAPSPAAAASEETTTEELTTDEPV